MVDPRLRELESSYWKFIWKQYKKHPIGLIALCVFLLFILVGIYAPLLASSKPLCVVYNGNLYFPFFRYLFYTGFYTKKLDLFYNLLMFTAPLAVFSFFFLKKQWLKIALWTLVVAQLFFFGLFASGYIKNPAANLELLAKREQTLSTRISHSADPLLDPFTPYPDWDFDLHFMTEYEKLNVILRYLQRREENTKLKPYAYAYYQATGHAMPTLWVVDQKNELAENQRLNAQLQQLQPKYEQALLDFSELIQRYRPLATELILTHKKTLRENSSDSKKDWEALKDKIAPLKAKLEELKTLIQNYRDLSSKLLYLKQRKTWLENESSHVTFMITPLIRPFHWEDDAGGEQKANKYLPWWELSRINRKDLVAALIFGVRISLVVGITAVTLALLIGIPIGTFSAYYGGKWDIFICRLIEIWEAMPVFFMLLLIVAISQSKSIFLVVLVLGIFGWTSFSRFIRGEVFKQRNLSYVLACHNFGFSNGRIMFSHILPNAIPPILTLLPFFMMGAITSEAALSFLGLGEEGSCSWGVLMDEGRSVFPGESYLLWPPAILLTILLICIALIGDSMRDAIDPKLA